MQMRGGVQRARITAVLGSTEAARSSFPYLPSAAATHARRPLSLPWIFPAVEHQHARTRRRTNGVQRAPWRVCVRHSSLGPVSSVSSPE